METNGISLNTSRKDKKNDRKSLFIGLVAGLGLAVALGGAFMLGGSNAGESGAGATQSVVEQTGGNDDGDGGAPTGSTGGGGGVDEPADAQEPADEPDQVDEPAQPAEPTATPTATATPDAECNFCPEVDDLAADPTPTPDDPCPLCPDDVDDIVAEPTPFVICPLCLEPQFDAELPALAFTETLVRHCEGFVYMNAKTNRNADIWVEYTKEGDDIESTHQYGMNFEEHETGTWMWFGDWGFVYPYNYTFYAEDDDGNVISWYEWLPEGCV